MAARRTPLFAGWSDRDARVTLPSGWLWIAENIIAANERGDAPPRLRPGLKPINATAIAETVCHGLYAFRSGATSRILYVGAGNVYMDDDWTTALAKGVGSFVWTWDRGDLWTFAKVKIGSTELIYACNGSDDAGQSLGNIRIDPATRKMWPAGIDEPSSAPTCTPGAAGNVTGTVTYVTTWYDSTLDRESNQSDPTTVTGIVDQQVSVVPNCTRTDTSYDQFRVYRTTDGGTILLRAGAANYGATFTDDVLDASLGDPYGSDENNEDVATRPPRCGAIARMQDGRLLYMDDVENGWHKAIYVSRDGDHPDEILDSDVEDPLRAGEENGARILCGVPYGEHICIIAEDGIYVVNADCTQCDQRVTNVRGVGRWCATSTPYGPIFVAPDGVYRFKGYAAEKISDPLGDLSTGTWASVDGDWLPYCAVGYDRKTDHVYVGVTTIAGSARNFCILALDCRTLDRRISAEGGESRSFPWPRWAKWLIRGEAICAHDWATAAGQNAIVAFGQGMLAELEPARKQDGPITGTVEGTATDATANTLEDTDAAFYATGSGLKGLNVLITGGVGAGQLMEIASNTATELTLVAEWTTTPLAGNSTYQVGVIPARMRTGAIDFGRPAFKKRIRHVTFFTEQP